MAEELRALDGAPAEANCYVCMSECLEETVALLFAAMFPRHFGVPVSCCTPQERQKNALHLCYDALVRLLSYVLPDTPEAERLALAVMDSLPEITAVLQTDIQAAYEGDPAAVNTDEVILTYPAFRAISIYRVAHRLYELHVPIVPRMMTEHAHKITGIDIHPGATIGRYFFIDHGTGVVIGETTTIGEHVKLYQHVTLGAKSFQANSDGTLVKGIKRHPDIGNNVIIYAGATILGGNTSIGDNCIIGGNVWLTRSVAPNRKVTNDMLNEMSIS